MKLGIVGSGMIVRDLFTFIHNIKDIEIVHISGTKRSEEVLKEMANEQHIARYSTNYDDLLNDSKVDTIYVALPNHLHYEYAKEALNAHKNVILEKPFTVSYDQARELKELAFNKHLFLWEAITNQYLPNYQRIKELLKDVGDIKIVECNFSQYSSRYDAFKQGNVLPAFDKSKAGGALMDLNIYNLHFVIGLFGEPIDIHYYPNIERGVDTSGILVLEYSSFKCVCIAAKDCKAPLSNNIQGDLGCIRIESPLSILDEVSFIDNKGNKQVYNDNKAMHRMYDEFVAFNKMYDEKDYKQCYERLEHSLVVTKMQTIARHKCKLYLGDELNEG